MKAKNIPACPCCVSYNVTRLLGGVVWECHECDATFVLTEVKYWRKK